MLKFFLVDVPEFEPVWRYCAAMEGVRVARSRTGFVKVESAGPLVLDRKEMGIKPAVWFGLFTGGLAATIERFDIDSVHLSALGDQ